MTLGDRIVVLRNGDVMQHDTPLALYNQPANLFVAGFIGSPPMNFLPGWISKSGGHMMFESAGGAVRINLGDSVHQQALEAYEDATLRWVYGPNISGNASPPERSSLITRPNC